MPQIHKKDLNDIFNDILGQSYDASKDDKGGCGMGRANGTWMCPELICQIVDEALELAGVEVIEDTEAQAA